MLAGMFVKFVLGGVSQTEPLQGVHKLAETSGNDSVIIEGCIPTGLEGKDLTPDLFSYPSFAVRVSAPYLLPPRPVAASHASVGARASVGGAGEGAREVCSREEAMGIEEFKPYTKGLNAVHTPRDIPASLRELDRTAQEFWLRCAPPRMASDLYYGAFTWADFERALHEEAAGGDSTLFGKFDFSDASSLASLRGALEAVGGGAALPTNAKGEAVVPPRLFAQLVQHAAAAAPSSIPDDERERFPPWLASHVPPVPEGGMYCVLHTLTQKWVPLCTLFYTYTSFLGMYICIFKYMCI